MTNINPDFVQLVLESKDFDILGIEAIDDNHTEFTIVHEIHPDDQIKVMMISEEADGQDSTRLEFEGPDVYTEEEAKKVLHEVMEALLEIIERIINEDMLGPGSGSGSGSNSGSGSSSGSNSGSGNVE